MLTASSPGTGHVLDSTIGGSSWEGLTQTRPALLPYAGALRAWVPKSRGPEGSRSPRVAKHVSHSVHVVILSVRVVVNEVIPSVMKIRRMKRKMRETLKSAE